MNNLQKDILADDYDEPNSKPFLSAPRKRNLAKALNEHYGINASEVNILQLPDNKNAVILPNSLFPEGSKVEIKGTEFD